MGMNGQGRSQSQRRSSKACKEKQGYEAKFTMSAFCTEVTAYPFVPPASRNPRASPTECYHYSTVLSPLPSTLRFVDTGSSVTPSQPLLPHTGVYSGGFNIISCKV